jgi:hypothetical protein
MNPQSQKLQLEKMMTIFGTGFRFSVKRIWAIFLNMSMFCYFMATLRNIKGPIFGRKKRSLKVDPGSPRVEIASPEFKSHH